MGGYLIVSDNVWSVREMRFSGRNEMVRFNNLVKMGNVGDSDEFLPLQYDVDATFRFLGNVVDGTYEAVLIRMLIYVILLTLKLCVPFL